MADPAPLTRRTVVTGAGVAAVGAGLLATGCSTAPPPTAPADAAAGTPVGPAADVPVGSAQIFDAAGVVVTQPSAGTYAAFSTACPHQGCAVSSVEGTSIVCPCHGSTFGLDGSVQQGPAEAPLQSRAITVTNGEISLA
ncbi:Rieske (2Fe-2S) protein [Pseudonocardia kunmingensis]|uniref:Cytochrome bc1 complex Rieske iron-sulfur subunit n=1 Tax=Pseudonocardia kunmingensis TaxID=630975 RepID=A0A543DYT2_9PSEU|nr:Rieske (2Fe-2S) protein [Pseudonocardia kunmingensis]TQM14497.1 nitrite reductase/ring-hydroxylating ferredoxin subunit [Pseudonocardia kunmingensis]